MTTKCLVVDDQAMVREGFTALLASQPDMDVVGQAANGAEAVRLCRELSPDVVLMDVRMPVMDGLEATRAITATPGKSPSVLMLTTFDLDEYVFEALRAGASGFALKRRPLAELLEAVRVVASGDGLLAPSVTRRLIAHFAKQSAPSSTKRGDLDRLTERENEVLLLVARGLSNAEIADELHMGLRTAKTHVSSVLMKVGARDRTQLVILAYESGLIQAP